MQQGGIASALEVGGVSVTDHAAVGVVPAVTDVVAAIAQLADALTPASVVAGRPAIRLNRTGGACFRVCVAGQLIRAKRQAELTDRHASLYDQAEV